MIPCWRKLKQRCWITKLPCKFILKNSIGIGEHPQHTEEMAKLLDKVAMAEDRVSVLQRHFKDIYGEIKNESKKR